MKLRGKRRTVPWNFGLWVGALFGEPALFVFVAVCGGLAQGTVIVLPRPGGAGPPVQGMLGERCIAGFAGRPRDRVEVRRATIVRGLAAALSCRLLFLLAVFPGDE
jgi:hypothetical protein